MDVLSKSQRSFNMSQIKNRDTKPELLFRQFLRDLRIPFSANNTQIYGKPDIYIPSSNLIVQIHGCFWHGHKRCRYFVHPKSNKEFWLKKINGNVKRDRKVSRALKKEGYRLCTIWECDLKNGNFMEKFLSCLHKI